MADVSKQSQEARVREEATKYKCEVFDLTLSKPFDIAGLEIETLYLRDPIAIDFDVWNLGEAGQSGGEMGLIRQLACKLASVAPDALDTLPAPDYMKLVEKLQPFLDMAQ